ncbi:MAG: AI-2E family transporter [Proteobacteria bacterium]|nr:AI-2E family transporter [Pseudomonadota bacterium]
MDQYVPHYLHDDFYAAGGVQRRHENRSSFRAQCELARAAKKVFARFGSLPGHQDHCQYGDRIVCRRSYLVAWPGFSVAVGEAGAAAIGFAAINVVFGNVIEPRMMGYGVGISPLVVFVGLVFWGWVFGPVGMLLSVPLTMALKLALESDERSRWIAILIGSERDAHHALQNKGSLSPYLIP